MERKGRHTQSTTTCLPSPRHCSVFMAMPERFLQTSSTPRRLLYWATVSPLTFSLPEPWIKTVKVEARSVHGKSICFRLLFIVCVHACFLLMRVDQKVLMSNSDMAGKSPYFTSSESKWFLLSSLVMDKSA